MSTKEIASLDSLRESSKICYDDPFAFISCAKDILAVIESDDTESADQILGTLIARNVCRMVNVTWPLLLQKAHEFKTTKIKLILIRHFANICRRINVNERKNAFRAFSFECTTLLGDVTVATDRTFLKSFGLAFDSLALYGETDGIHKIFEVLRLHISTTKRVDIQRSVIQLLGKVLFFSKVKVVSGTLDYVKSLDFSVFLLLLDHVCGYLSEKNAKQIAFKGGKMNIATACMYVDVGLDTILAGIYKNSDIPVIVSCIGKLSECEADYTLSREKDFLVMVLGLLRNSPKKIIIGPLLKFLRDTKIDWSFGSDLVMEYCESSDAFIRCEAFSALAGLVDKSKSPREDYKLELAQQKLQFYLSAKCALTVCGLLKFLQALCKKVLRRPVAKAVLHSLLHLLNTNMSVISANFQNYIVLLSIIKEINAFDRETFLFVKKCIYNEHRDVRSTALRLFLKWCEVRNVGIFEGDYMPGSLLFQRQQGPEKVEIRNDANTTLFHVRMFLLDSWLVLTETYDYLSKETHTNVVSFCDTLIAATIFVEGRGETYLDNDIYTYCWYLFDLMQGSDTFPTTIYVSIFNALAECTKRQYFSYDDSQEGYLVVFNFVWNMLDRCAKTVDQLSTCDLHCEDGLFFCYTELSEHVANLIVSIAEVALNNKESIEDSEFYQLVDSSLALVTIMMRGMKNVIHPKQKPHVTFYVLNTMNVLSTTNPSSVATVVSSLFKTFYFSGNRFCSREEGNKEATDFLSECRPVLHKLMSVEISVVGASLFELSNLIVWYDGIWGTRMYLSLDEKMDFFRASVAFAGDKRNHFFLSDSAFEAMLLGFYLFLSGPYRSAVATLIDLDALDEIQEAVANRSYSPRIKFIMVQLRQLLEVAPPPGYDAVARLVSSLRLIEGPEQFFGTFEGLYELCSEDPALKAKALLFLKEGGSCFDVFCAAALDSAYIVAAVESVLHTRVEDYLIEFLTLIIEEAEEPALDPVSFDTSGCVNDRQLVNHLLQVYAARATCSSREDEEGEGAPLDAVSESAAELWVSVEKERIETALAMDEAGGHKSDFTINTPKFFSVDGVVPFITRDNIKSFVECYLVGKNRDTLQLSSPSVLIDHLIRLVRLSESTDPEADFDDDEKVEDDAIRFLCTYTFASLRIDLTGSPEKAEEEERMLTLLNLCLHTKAPNVDALCEVCLTMSEGLDFAAFPFTYASVWMTLTCCSKAVDRLVIQSHRMEGIHAKDLDFLTLYYSKLFPISDSVMQFLFRKYAKFLSIDCREEVEPVLLHHVCLFFTQVLAADHISSRQKKVHYDGLYVSRFPLSNCCAATYESLSQNVDRAFFPPIRVTWSPPLRVGEGAGLSKEFHENVLCAVVVATLNNLRRADELSPFLVRTFLFSLNHLVLSHTLTPNTTTRNGTLLLPLVRQRVSQWFAQYAHPSLLAPKSSDRVTETVLADPRWSPVCYDALATASALGILCAIPVPIPPQPQQLSDPALAYTNWSANIPHILRVLGAGDVFSKSVALQSYSIFITSQSAEACTQLITPFLKLFPVALQSNTSFICLEALHAAEQTLTRFSPGERACEKMLEGLWGGLIEKPNSLFVQRCGHHLLRCLMAVAGEKSSLGALVGVLCMDAEVPLLASGLDDSMCLAGQLRSSEEQLLKWSSHAFFLLRKATTSGRGGGGAAPASIWTQAERDRRVVEVLEMQAALEKIGRAAPYLILYVDILNRLLAELTSWENCFCVALNHLNFGSPPWLSTALHLLLARADACRRALRKEADLGQESPERMPAVWQDLSKWVQVFFDSAMARVPAGGDPNDAWWVFAVVLFILCSSRDKRVAFLFLGILSDRCSNMLFEDCADALLGLLVDNPVFGCIRLYVLRTFATDEPAEQEADKISVFRGVLSRKIKVMLSP